MKAKTELTKIPGVGEKIAVYLQQLGVNKVADLEGCDPQELYDRLCVIEQFDFDRCLLYVFRSAVYFAENKEHDPELLKWWNWKDEKAQRQLRS